jgi:hypothetical protein
MWELVSEPEGKSAVSGSCDEAAASSALRSFFDTVGAEMHRVDTHHLIQSGVIGSGQCGASGGNYRSLHESSGIDVASYHDYGDDATPLPGDQWNGLALRLKQMSAVGKPLVVGELGINGQQSLAGCMSLPARSGGLMAKLAGQFAAGVKGVMIWDWVPSNAGTCDYDFTTGDPILGALRNYPL